MVKDLILPTRSWNLDLIQLKLPLDVNSILSIQLAGSEVPDELCWHYSADGCYTVKSGYNVGLERSSLSASTSSHALSSFWKKIWHSPLPKKVLIFIWRVLSNAIPTNVLFRSRRVRVSPHCSCCDLEVVKDSSHVFFGCSRAQEVW